MGIIERPKTLTEFIGQEKIKKELRIRIESAKIRNVPMNHLIVYSNFGMGKNSLCYTIATELNVPFREFNCANLQTHKDIINIFLNITNKDIIYFDEVHRLRIPQLEAIYNPLADNELVIKEAVIPLQPFSLFASTTSPGKLSLPFLSRFPIKVSLEDYTIEELSVLAEINLNKIGLRSEKKACQILAQRSKGVPRVLNNYILWLKDVATVHNVCHVSSSFVDKWLKDIGVDERGFTADDKKYIQFLRNIGTASLATISAGTDLDTSTIEQVIEPWLIKQKIVKKTPRGRMLIKS